MSDLCPVCRTEMKLSFRAEVLNRHDVAYFHCRECGLLRTENPYWLNQAYGSAIAATDTGIVQRNLLTARRLVPLLHYCFPPNGACLDVAGGSGLLVRLMRDHGFDFYWDDKYCSNLMAGGFEAARSAQAFSLLTAFEVIEHVHDPLEFVQNLFQEYRTRSLIFSTDMYRGDDPPPLSWGYYAFGTGQHICFTQERTWQRIAERLGVQFHSFNNFHLLLDRPINEWLASWVTGRPSLILAPLVRRIRGSLTQVDHALLMPRNT